MTVRLRAVVVATVLAARAVATLDAQTLPSRPLVLADDHLTVGGDIALSVAPKDPGYFNFTDYQHSPLRLVRFDVTAALKVGDHLSVLGDVRSENIEYPRPYALYVRIRPWLDRPLDFQVGRIPPTFGAFARRTYAADNFLIGYPLAYQYVTSIRPDSVPASADDLLRLRGNGWRARYSIGNSTPGQGVPLVSAFTWDTGVQVHTGNEMLDATGAVTVGTLSNPLFHEDNDGKQIVGRLAVHPIPGLIIGTSAARGPFVSRVAARAAATGGDNNRFTQTAWGADVEYSHDYYLVRFETIVSDWTLPIVRAPILELPLQAWSTSVEGRYKLWPGLYVAGRFDHLGFSEVIGSRTRNTWDAPVSRLEVGGGYSLQRNLLLKLSYQYNTRDGGKLRSLNLGAAQLLFWF